MRGLGQKGVAQRLGRTAPNLAELQIRRDRAAAATVVKEPSLAENYRMIDGCGRFRCAS